MITLLSLSMLLAVWQGAGVPGAADTPQIVISVLLTLIFGVGGLYVRSLMTKVTDSTKDMKHAHTEATAKLTEIQHGVNLLTANVSAVTQQNQEILRRMGQVEERQYLMEQNIGERNEQIGKIETRLDMHLKNHPGSGFGSHLG